MDGQLWREMPAYYNISMDVKCFIVSAIWNSTISRIIADGNPDAKNTIIPQQFIVPGCIQTSFYLLISRFFMHWAECIIVHVWMYSQPSDRFKFRRFASHPNKINDLFRVAWSYFTFVFEIDPFHIHLSYQFNEILNPLYQL